MSRLAVRNRNRRWLTVVIVATGLTVAAASAGHGGISQRLPDAFKPRFDDLSQYIRYHPGFHDAHSHDGYGHGHHGGNSTHVHDPSGQAISYRFLLFHPWDGHAPLTGGQPWGSSLTDPLSATWPIGSDPLAQSLDQAILELGVDGALTDDSGWDSGNSLGPADPLECLDCGVPW
jgi:hypothetical protein